MVRFTHLYRTLIEIETDLQVRGHPFKTFECQTLTPTLYQSMAVVTMSLTAAADLTIAGSMAYYLLRNRTGFKR